MEEYLKGLLRQYRELYDEIQPDVERLKEVLDHMTAPLKQLESEIKEEVIERGTSESGYDISVTYRSGYTRHKWDNKGLQGYAVANEDVLAFHSETKVGPSAAIKVK